MNNENKKKGFTLIELLAVIIILAVLMLIAVPGILNIMSKSKKNAFRSQAETIYKAAQTQSASESATGGSIECYKKTGSNAIVGGTKGADNLEVLDLSGNTNIDYYVKFTNGKISSIKVYDSKSKYSIGGTTINDLDTANIGENANTNITTTDVCTDANAGS